MKPCSRKRKRIAWLSLGLLSDAEARDLRSHIETCEGCRSYLAEISRVNQRLEAVKAPDDIRASADFHRRLARALRAEAPRPFWESLAAFLRARNPGWRTAIPALGVIAVAVVAWTLLARRPVITAPRPGAAPAAAASAKGVPPPTLANYMAAANHSLDDFDALLTREGNRKSARLAVYTASLLEYGDRRE
jgi:anti-sigma factor RsiW